MSSKSGILAEIKSKVGSSGYPAWRIGLTHDLAERKKQWKDEKGKDVTYWTTWKADSLADAQEIEAYFIGKGMKGGTGGDLSSRKSVYVYIF